MLDLFIWHSPIQNNRQELSMTTTNQNQPILVAIDFSEDSEAALLWAGNYTKCTKSPLIILHVVHDPADAPGFYRSEDDDWAEPMTAVANRMAEDFMKKMYEKYPSLSSIHMARVEFVRGLPPGRIVEFAEKEHAQIIVMGSCGRSGLRHILLGSVTERVAQLSKIPVVIVKTPVAEEKKHD
jgi:nucleotide-binding universal stress UspA family protein